MGWYANQQARYEAAKARKDDGGVRVVNLKGSPSHNAKGLEKAIREQAADGYVLDQTTANAGRGVLSAQQILTVIFRRAEPA